MGNSTSILHGKGSGWRPDAPDARDHLWRAPFAHYANPAPSVRLDLTTAMPKPYDQGQLGSCTGNAIAAAVEYDLHAVHRRKFVPSRLFIYYNERVMEGTVDQDAGAEIRDGIKSVASAGVCHESLWHYDIARFTHEPPPSAYSQALQTRVADYARVPQDGASWMAAHSMGRTIVYGFTVYQSFESQAVADSGLVPMPEPGEQVLGGHAVLSCGHVSGLELVSLLGAQGHATGGVDPAAVYLRVRNSWGVEWGDGGYFWMPLRYVTTPGLASDFWTLNTLA